MIKDDLLRAGFDTYGVNLEDKLLENNEIYLNDKKESERIMNRLLEVLEEKIYGNGVIEKEYAYRMGVLDGLDLAEFIDLNKKLCLKRN
ncbi:hypothetical protein I6B27_19265 [Clostridioides difficile]|nr:hypothetical protein [Clostridioides difficile]